MSENNPKELIRRVYDKISLRPEGVSLDYLASVFDINKQSLEEVVINLRDGGLVQIKEGIISPVPWWQADYVEVAFEIPRVSQNTFSEYTKTVDDLAEKLRENGQNVIRPYQHETTILFLLSVAAGFALAEFFKGLLGDLGKMIAKFIGDTVEKFSSDGITEVYFKGTRRAKDGTMFLISVKASSEKKFQDLLEEIQTALDTQVVNLESSDELSLKGTEWDVTLKKIGG